MLRNFFLCLALTLSIYVNAQESSTEVSESMEYSETVDLLATASRLIKYGYKTKDALPLIQAVEIYKRIGIRPESEVGQKTTVVDSVAADVVSEKQILPLFDAQQLLEDAAKFADGDQNLLNIIQSVSDTRGGLGGPVPHTGVIKPYSTDAHIIAFEGGEVAVVTVVGDGDTNLDLYIYDINGQPIVCDNSSNLDCCTSFVPDQTAEFIVKVRNLGRMPNYYYIVTN